MRVILLWMALLACNLSQAAPPVAIEFNPPPPFGYGVGSVIYHQVELFTPAPWQLDIAQLPTPGLLNHWLELRDFAYEKRQESRGNYYRLKISYQIFPALHQAQTLEIPSLPLTLITPAKEQQTISLPAWSFTVTPLIPPQWSDAEVKIRPLWQPQAIDLTPHWQRLSWIGVGLLLVGFTLVWHRFARRRLPFARALPKIRRLARKGQAEAALRVFHQALNETAGKALFAHQLADFIARQPAFASCEDNLRKFFEHSQQFFYTPRQELARAWLLELEKLCRDCAKAERQCRK